MRPVRIATTRSSLADQADVHAYDHIDLPPIRPIVTPIHRHRGRCPCCRQRVAAPAPEGFEPGSPFGPELCALIIHLHVTQAIGFQRLARLMAEAFSVAISEGAIANILARAAKPLLAAVEPIAAAVRASPVVGSDETSARVGGRDLVAMGAAELDGDLPRDRRTRAASVATAFLAGARPEVWVADRYSGQVGHGAVRQICLAHLLRDAQFAIDEGCATFAPGFRILLLRAVAIGKRRDRLARHHVGAIPRRSGPAIGSAAVGASAETRGGAPSVARHVPPSRRSVSLHRPPRRALHEQRLRARAQALGDLPQGDRRVPRGVGRQSLCSRGQRDRHRAATWPDRPCSPTSRPGRRPSHTSPMMLSGGK